MAGPSYLTQAMLDQSIYTDDSSICSSSEAEEASEAESEVEYGPDWSPTPQCLRIIPFQRANELLVPVPGKNKPVDWFCLVCDIFLLDQIVNETNTYARSLLENACHKPNSRITKWHDLTVTELNTFIGLIFQMGTVRTNRICDYWKTSRFFNFPAIREQMSRDRFHAILRCLHFAPDTTESDYLSNVQILINYFNDKMTSIYYPSKEMCIDEGMALWRGRLFCRQSVKSSRLNYGAKIFTLREPNGLVMNFVIHYGQGSDIGGKGHADKIVMTLMEQRFHVGHSIFMDKFYNSFSLACQLLQNGTYCTGTLGKHRKNLPDEVKNTKLCKDQTVQCYYEGVMVGKWKDVLYLSTEFDNVMAVYSNSRGVAKVQPLPIIQYNACMKMIGRSGQLMLYYPSDHKSLRWTTKIFVYVLQLLMFNANKLHNFANPNKKITLYDFRQEVIEALLPPKSLPPPRRPRTNQHVLAKIPDRDKKNKILRKRCRVCYKDGYVKKTVYMCNECPGQPGLCPVGCFDKFHSE